MAEMEALFGSDDDGSENDGSAKSASGSEAGSVPGSPQGSNSDGSEPGTPKASGSEAGSAPGSPQASGSEVESNPSGSERGSPARSGSGSPARSGSGTPHSQSRSPAGSEKSGSRSPAGSNRSGSRSPRSRSGSPESARSAGSPSGSARSGSASPARSRSRSSGSAHSRSGSPGSARSRSGSPGGAQSQSGSPQSPAGSTQSGSPRRSQSGSPRVRSRSQSPVKSGSGSDSETEAVHKKARKTVLSDESDVEMKSDKEDANLDVDAGDLFGDADDISSGSEDEGAKKEGQETGPVIEDDEEEKEKEEEPPQETRIEVEIPKISTDLGNQIHFLKLPNFLSVETRPFDSSTYEDEVDEDEVLDEEGRARTKLKVENTIRWRTKKDEDGNEVTDENGKPVRESNARILKWSDGSMSLHLGTEIFDIHPMSLSGDFNHLFIRQGTGLQGQAVFKTKLTFRPHSTDSFTHRKMTLSLADRSTKMQKIRMLPISGVDPEKDREQMIKKEEERLRASLRRESQQRRVRERAHSRGLSSSYLEDEDDEGGISISAIKKQYKEGGKDFKTNIYSSDSEDFSGSDKEDSRNKRLMKAKKLESDEDSDDDSGPKKKKARVVESDEEDD